MAESMRWNGLRPDGLGDFDTDAKLIVSWVNSHGGAGRYYPACRCAEHQCGFTNQSIAVRTADGWAYAKPGDTIHMTDKVFWPSVGHPGEPRRRTRVFTVVSDDRA